MGLFFFNAPRQPIVALRSDSVNRNSEDQAMREHFQAFLKYIIKPQATGTLSLGLGADPRGFNCRLTFCQVI